MKPIRKMTTLVTALAAVGALLIPWQHTPSEARADDARSAVEFTKRTLPGANDSTRVGRTVAPGIDHISAWISAVGASVGAMDLRGIGRDGDACLTDPRDDRIHVFAIPGSGGEEFEPFTLEATGLRYDSTMAPIGCVPVDIDSDGRLDVVAYYWGRSPIVFRNTGTLGSKPGPESFRASELVSPMQVWNTTALNFADIDGDGRLDIFVGNYFPDGARVLDPRASDDERMAMNHSLGAAHNAGTNRLLLGGEHTADALEFTDASTAVPEESARSWTLAVGFQDLSGNGLPDAYIANDFGPDQLLVNTSTPGRVRLTPIVGQRGITKAKSLVLGNDSFKGMGVTFSYEPDQRLPRIFVSNITSPWALQESNLAFYPNGPGSDLLRGSVPFTQRAADVGIAHSGWSWDIKAVDVDNSGHDSLVQATGFVQGTRDMWPRLQEMAMGNDQLLAHPGAWVTLKPGDDLSGHERDRLWRPVGDSFVDAGSNAGFSTSDVTRGFAITDFNGDGRQDIVSAQQWGDSYSWENTGRSENPSLSVRPARKGDNGTATLYGATVRVRYPGGERTAQLYPGNGHSGVSSSRLHFALPGITSGSSDASGQVTATVEWVDGGTVRRHEVPVRITDNHTVLDLEVP
ncbi:MAG: CRTAC1 family protein [Phycicoccus sp.]